MDEINNIGEIEANETITNIYQRDKKQISNKINQLRNKIGSLKQANIEKARTKFELLGQVKRLEHEIEMNDFEVVQIEAQIKILSDELNDLNSQIDTHS